jgi:WD40 repeat protein
MDMKATTTTATFSPLGDFLLSGGDDNNIVIWNTNLNPMVTEELYGITATRLDTEVYVTDKAELRDFQLKLKSQPKRKVRLKSCCHHLCNSECIKFQTCSINSPTNLVSLGTRRQRSKRSNFTECLNQR